MESELVELRMKLRDLEHENKLIKKCICILEGNDTHTKTILTVLWVDLKKRNEEKVVYIA